MNADNTMKTTTKPSKHDWSRFDAMSQQPAFHIISSTYLFF